jgi:hypothetical protein
VWKKHPSNYLLHRCFPLPLLPLVLMLVMLMLMLILQHQLLLPLHQLLLPLHQLLLHLLPHQLLLLLLVLESCLLRNRCLYRQSRILEPGQPTTKPSQAWLVLLLQARLPLPPGLLGL